MIIRISTEGQYHLDDGMRDRVNELDNKAVAAVETGDEAAFRAAFAALLDVVRSEGSQLSDDDLHPSDVILPPADTSLEEARTDFSGDGLIPD